MAIVCGACGSAIDGAQVDDVLHRAFCRPCRRFTSFPDAPVPSAERFAEMLAPSRAIEPMVASMYRERVVAGGSSIEVQRSAESRGALQLRMALALVLVGGPGVWLLIEAFRTSLVAGLILVGVAARSAATLVARVRSSFNRVVVRVDGADVSLRELPIAGGLARTVRIADVVRVEVVRASAPAPIGRGDALTWDVRVTLRDGDAIDLDLRLDRAGHAQFVASRIERALTDANADAYRRT